MRDQSCIPQGHKPEACMLVPQTRAQTFLELPEMEKLISLSHGHCDAYVRYYIHLALSRYLTKTVYPPFSPPVYDEFTFLQSF